MGKSTEKILTIVLIFLVFSGFYFWLAPYAEEGVGEGRTDMAQENVSGDISSEEALRASTDSSGGTGGSEISANKENQPKAADHSLGYLILVNKTHGLGKSYKPKDLTSVKYVCEDRPGAYQKLRKKAAKAFAHLSKAAGKKGRVIRLTTGFRPYEYQKALYKQYVQADGKKRAEQYSAKPGFSEHQTGLCADVSSPSVDYQLVQKYGKTKEGKWLEKNAWKYGFIIRYPKGGEAITGYEYEPWHIRYVGKAAAKEIYRQDTTLEEYLEEL